MISTEHKPAAPPYTLVLTDEEMMTLRTALLLYIMQPSVFTSPKPRQLLTTLDTSIARMTKRRQKMRLPTSADDQPTRHPLLDEINPFCTVATAGPVKAASGLAAKAAPQAVTGPAQPRTRSAIHRKAKPAPEPDTCPEC